MSTHADSNLRPPPDRELVEMARYVSEVQIESAVAYDSARYCLLDSLGCAILAVRYPASHRHLGPLVPGTVVPHGARVPGTNFELDPVKAAFDTGCLIRWLDYNDTWLAAEWGHPSDNLGGILAVADHLSRQKQAQGREPLTVRDVLTATIKAYEIQGLLALENSFNRVGLDHVLLVKVATTAVVMGLLGGTQQQIVAALSHAWVDGASLRTYRHAPNVGPRKSWAAGEATSRGVRLALMTLAGEPGLPSPLTTPTWGFYDVCFQGQRFTVPRQYGSHVIENVLFKLTFPAEFHAQTAVECALALHPLVKDRLEAIERIELTTQEAAVRIISKTGPLYNPADRDHCLQYVVAVALVHGQLTADYYEDPVALDPRLDALRARMTVQEEPRYTRDYLDPDKRSIANAVQVFFQDGTATPRVEVEYPPGHQRRRRAGLPLLVEKCRANLTTLFSASHVEELLELFLDQPRLEQMSVPDWMEKLVWH